MCGCVATWIRRLRDRCCSSPGRTNPETTTTSRMWIPSRQESSINGLRISRRPLSWLADHELIQERSAQLFREWSGEKQMKVETVDYYYY